MAGDTARVGTGHARSSFLVTAGPVAPGIGDWGATAGGSAEVTIRAALLYRPKSARAQANPEAAADAGGPALLARRVGAHPAG